MAAVIKCGQIYAIGDVNLSLDAGMFLYDTTYAFPSSIRLPVSGGTYVGCSKLNASTLTITNPASDSTFTFPIQGSEDDTTWIDGNITGVVYHSEGSYNISLNNIRTVIGETTYSLAGLCASSLVNPYSLYKPNGSSPYRLGDFRWYAHGALGGTYVTYTKPSTSVNWGDTYTVRAIGSKRWIEIPGKPFTTSRVVLILSSADMDETTINFNTTFGAVAEYTTAAETPSAETVYTWYAKTQHFTGGAYVDGSTETFTVTRLGRPWTITFDSGPTRTGEELSIQIDYVRNYGSAVVNIKFSATDSHGTATLTESSVDGNTADIAMTLFCPGGNNWDAGYTWTLEVDYPAGTATWYGWNV